MADVPDKQAWITLSVIVPHEIADAVANFLHECGAPGLVLDEEGPHATKITSYLQKSRWRRVSSDLERYFRELREIFPGLQDPLIDMVPLKSENWATAWKSRFKPIKIGEKLIITPPWLEPKAKGRQVVIIEPAEAFGTGTHETTQACLILLEQAIKDLSAPRKEVTLLDVGCGSGILAIAGIKLGAVRVRAVDNDPVAIQAAHANAVLNRVEDELRLEECSVKELTESTDVVTANLDPTALIENRDKLVSLAGHHLIISGVPLNQWSEIKNRFLLDNLFLKNEITRSEWGTGLFAKKKD